MDRFDALLLEAVQADNRLTADGLSKLVGLSPDACRKRLGKLRKQGLIQADIALLAPELIGRGLIIIVEVSMEEERRSDLNDFKQSMLASPEVMQCYYVTGSADFFLIMSAVDMADYEAFTQRHLMGDNVARFRTSVVMDRVKMGFFMPVAEGTASANGHATKVSPPPGA